MEPATRPNVAAAMPMVSAPCRPMPSSTLLNPPTVPCPPVMETLPAAMPTRGSTPISRVRPKGIKFCRVMLSASRISMKPSSLPPCLMTLRSHWKPTLVKNAIMKTSCKVLTNDTSTSNQT